MNMFKKNGGFTLVELIVVIAILAILAGVAIPAYSGYIEKAKDAAVITKLDAIQTAAQAANATSGAIETITVSTTGTTTLTTTVTVTTDADATEDADKIYLSTSFDEDFDMFYGCDDVTIAAKAGSVEITLDEAIDLSGTSFKNGAVWVASAPMEVNSVTYNETGWNKIPDAE